MTQRQLIPLGEGVFTVSQVCRILQPGMTSRKVHYWLKTNLIAEPLAWGRPGHPTLLNFKQLLQIRTVQRMRDELRVPLPKVRGAFEWVIGHAFADDPSEVRFDVADGFVVATAGDESIVVLGTQAAQPMLVRYNWSALNADLAVSSRAWVERALPIDGTKHLIANARVQGGAPTVKGTRIETSFIAAFADEGQYTRGTIVELRRMHPRLKPAAIKEAFRFEGVALAA